MTRTGTLLAESTSDFDGEPEITLDDLEVMFERLRQSMKPMPWYAGTSIIGRDDGLKVAEAAGQVQLSENSSGTNNAATNQQTVSPQSSSADRLASRITAPTYTDRPLPKAHRAAARETFARALLGDVGSGATMTDATEYTPEVAPTGSGFLDFMPALRAVSAARSDTSTEGSHLQPPMLSEARGDTFVDRLVAEGAVRLPESITPSSDSRALHALEHPEKTLTELWGPAQNGIHDSTYRDTPRLGMGLMEEERPDLADVGSDQPHLDAMGLVDPPMFGAGSYTVDAEGYPNLGPFAAGAVSDHELGSVASLQPFAGNAPETPGSSELDRMTAQDKEEADIANQAHILQFIGALEREWGRLKSSKPGTKRTVLLSKMYERANDMIGLGSPSSRAESALHQAVVSTQHDVRAMIHTEREIRHANRLVQRELGLTLNHLVALCLKSVEGRPVDGLSVRVALFGYLDWIGVEITASPFIESIDARLADAFPGREKFHTRRESLRENAISMLLDSDASTRVQAIWARGADAVRRIIEARPGDQTGQETDDRDVQYRAPRAHQPMPRSADNPVARRAAPIGPRLTAGLALQAGRPAQASYPGRQASSNRPRSMAFLVEDQHPAQQQTEANAKESGDDEDWLR